VKLDKDGKTVLSVDYGNDAIQIREMTGLKADTAKKRLTGEDDSYEYGEKALFLYEDEKISPKELEPCDLLEVKMVEDIIWSVDVLEYQAVYAMVDGAVQCIFSTEQINICKDGVVELIENLPCGNRVHCYYRYENGVGTMVDYLRYDGQKDPNNPWFRSNDASGLDISLEPITQEEFAACRNAYSPIELDLKPLTDFSNT
jgi:hypothetical protein